MKKIFICIAAVLLLMTTGTAYASSGDIEGTVKGPLDLGLEVVVHDAGSGNWDRGNTGVGVAIGGARRKTDKTIELQLISKTADMKSLSAEELVAWYKDGIAPSSVDVFITRSGDKGEYSFTGVPEGKYFLVILMPGGGELTGEADMLAELQELKGFLRAWDMYQLFTIGMKLYSVQTVEVKSDTITHFDYNFMDRT